MLLDHGPLGGNRRTSEQRETIRTYPRTAAGLYPTRSASHQSRDIKCTLASVAITWFGALMPRPELLIRLATIHTESVCLAEEIPDPNMRRHLQIACPDGQQHAATRCFAISGIQVINHVHTLRNVPERTEAHLIETGLVTGIDVNLRRACIIDGLPTMQEQLGRNAGRLLSFQ